MYSDQNLISVSSDGLIYFWDMIDHNNNKIIKQCQLSIECSIVFNFSNLVYNQGSIIHVICLS